MTMPFVNEREGENNKEYQREAVNERLIVCEEKV